MPQGSAAEDGTLTAKLMVYFSPQQPKEICALAGFCPEMKKSVPMLDLQPAKAIPAAKTMVAAKLFPATKVEAPASRVGIGRWILMISHFIF